MRARRGMAVLGALLAILLVAALALAVVTEVGARWRDVARQRAGQVARLASVLTADSVAVVESGVVCSARTDSLAGPAPLLREARLVRIVGRSPRPSGGCRWQVEGRVLSADGLLFAAHRAVRRSDPP